MPNIKPISDLRNYATVLETVQVGKPLYASLFILTFATKKC